MYFTHRVGQLTDGVHLILCAIADLVDGLAGLVGRSRHLAGVAVDGHHAVAQSVERVVDVVLQGGQIATALRLNPTA